MDFDYGAPTELLSGDIYRPLDQSVPNQIWSSGNTISAFVEGLLGLSANIFEKKITFSPSIPPNWNYLRIKNLRVGQGKISFQMKGEKNALMFNYKFYNLEGYNFSLLPRIPAYEKQLFVEEKLQPESVSIKINNKEFSHHLKVKISKYLFPVVAGTTAYGAFSQQPIIENFELKDRRFRLTLWGKRQVEVHLYTDCNLQTSEGIICRNGEVTTLSLRCNDTWERKIITLAIIQ